MEVELTLLFADVRGSTQMAEEMGTVEFSRLISRFFGVSSKVLLRSQAWVDRLVVDQPIGMCIPFYAGEDHQRVAISAGRDLLPGPATQMKMVRGSSSVLAFTAAPRSSDS